LSAIKSTLVHDSKVDFKLRFTHVCSLR